MSEGEEAITWNLRYWDVIEELYWTPKYLGFRSITQKHWRRDEDFVCVPRSLVNEKGPLYSRALRQHDLIAELHRSEEVFNHVLLVAMAIAPDALLRDLFLEPLGLVSNSELTCLGREVRDRYGWGPYDNVTQQDAFFAGADIAVGVEIKLGASSNASQVVKYAALLTWEEMATGPKDNLGLLFVMPEKALAGHWGKCGLGGPSIDRTFLDQHSFEAPKRIKQLLLDHRDQVESVLDRMLIGAVSWSEFRQRITAYRQRLDESRPGDQTLARLIDGVVSQLEAHEGLGLAD